MSMNLASPVDHTPDNIYTPTTVKSYRKMHSPVCTEIRKDSSKRNGNKDKISESCLPLIMSSGTPSPPGFTNKAVYDDRSIDCDDVILQDLPTPLPRQTISVISEKQGLKRTQYNAPSDYYSDPLPNGQGNDEKNGHCRQEETMGYVVPSSLFDHDIYLGDYVQEDGDEFVIKGKGDYLTPLDIPRQFELENSYISGPGLAPSITHDNDHLISVNERGGRTKRFDSGLGDCDNGLVRSTSLSSVESLSNPRLSLHVEQHYEDIDTYAKEYKKGKSDERNAMETNPNPSKKRNLHPLPSVHLTGVTHTESEDIAVPEDSQPSFQNNPKSHERIQEDDSLPKTYLHLNNENRETPLKKKEKKNQCGCLMACLFFFIFVSMASLSISVYVLLTREDSHQKQDFTATASSSSSVNVTYASSEDFDVLKIEMSKLRTENSMLKDSLELYQNSSLLSVQSLQREIEMMQIDQVNASMDFQSVTQTLRSEIANISLTPGPQGIQGVGNFSLCKMKSTSIELAASSHQSTDTDYAPSADALTDTIILFAFCSYTGATAALLEYRKESSKIRYRCKCSGTVTGQLRTACTLYWFVCPRLNLHTP